MVSFLLTISFLLHIITLFAIFQLLKQQQENKKETDPQDIMEIMQVYLEEIREENDRLDKLLKKQGTNTESSEQQLKKMKDDNITENVVEEQKIDSGPESEDKQLDSLLENSPQDEVNASLESRVMQLHMQGKNIEEIAKILNCGKTEAELIIKLYQKT